MVLVAGLLIGGAAETPSSTTSTSAAAPGPVTVSPPAVTGAATVSTCAQVISALPLTLAGDPLRRTVSNPPSSSIVAWGDPAIVLRCGVRRPPQLSPSLADQLFLINGAVLVLPRKESDATVFTVVDRSVYIDVTVPSSYQQPPLGPIATAIAKVLPAPVCGTDTAGPRDKLCTRRK